MRSASLLGVLALAALVGSAAPARTQPYDAVIRQETDVRSGHGDGPMFYPTNHLHVGDRVRVVKEEDGGWVAIVPPSGSYSWIRKDLLITNDKQQPPITMVNDDADVRIGSTLTNQPPVVGKRAVRGTIVYLLPKNNEVRDGDGTWVSIYPPEGEVRYIRAEAIQAPLGATAEKTPAVVTVPPLGAPATGLPTANPPAAPGQDAETLYRQALDAEKYNPQTAIALYYQGAGCDADADRATKARTRADWLRDSLRNPSPNIVPGLAPGADPRASAPPSESKVYPLPGDPSAAPTVRLSAPQPVNPSPTHSSSAPPTTPWPPASGTATEYSTHPGWLQRSGRTVEGRKTYMMMSSNKTPFYYVTAQPGVDLDSYVGRHVECFGEAIYSGDLRANYMRVARVELRDGQ